MSYHLDLPAAEPLRAYSDEASEQDFAFELFDLLRLELHAAPVCLPVQDADSLVRDPELVRTIKELSPRPATMISYQRTKPYAMIHHDYHLNNLIFMKAKGAFLQGQAYTDEVEIFARRIFSAIVDLKSRETPSLLHA